MATRAELDIALTTHKGTIAASQNAYYALSGCYQQLKIGQTIIDDTEVHIYNGPKGHGYQIILWAVEGEYSYVKSDHYGPETHRADYSNYWWKTIHSMSYLVSARL